MSKLFYSAKKLLEIIDSGQSANIFEATVAYEEELTGRSREEILAEMKKRYGVMKDAIKTVMENPQDIKTKVGTPTTPVIKEAIENSLNGLLNSEVVLKANLYAIAVMECNASMGRIVAAPTAGSAGILPGSMLAIQEHKNLSDDQIVEGLFVAAGIGLIIAAKSTFSAAKAGCQAEVGSSSSMSAGALAYLQGLDARGSLVASALSLQNMLGLACDPVGGLVEIPCIKRNGFGVSNAFLACDMASMRVVAEIPFDEVVDSMNNVAENMHSNIRETAKGGLAVTPTALRLYKEYLEKKKQKLRSK